MLATPTLYGENMLNSRICQLYYKLLKSMHSCLGILHQQKEMFSSIKLYMIYIVEMEETSEWLVRSN